MGFPLGLLIANIFMVSKKKRSNTNIKIISLQLGKTQQ